MENGNKPNEGKEWGWNSGNRKTKGRIEKCAHIEQEFGRIF